MHIKSIDSIELICTIKDDTIHDRKCRITIPGANNAIIEDVTKRIVLNVLSTDTQALDTEKTSGIKEEICTRIAVESAEA